MGQRGLGLQLNGVTLAGVSCSQASALCSLTLNSQTSPPGARSPRHWAQDDQVMGKGHIPRGSVQVPKASRTLTLPGALGVSGDTLDVES